MWGVLCLAAGVWTLIKQPYSTIDIGILGLPTFFGLRRGARGWRTWALIHLTLRLIAQLILIGVVLFASPPPVVHYAGFRLPTEPKLPIVATASAVSLLFAWMLYVLNRPEVRALFTSPRAAGRETAPRT